jgi:hypothetical protein
VTVSTLTVAPEASASGAAPCAEPTLRHLWLLRRSLDVRMQALGRAAEPDFEDWLRHVKPAAGCARPILLGGHTRTIEASTGRILSTAYTTDTMPDGVIYKPCGNRRASACPSCSRRYQRDAYQVIRAGLVGGKGVPATVARHPALFVTLTAPSFGPVHTRVVRRHTCGDRRRCDCRPEPCRARRDAFRCVHGTAAACYARHDPSDRSLGTPLCLDCYDYRAQVVWNLHAGELWRRTRIGIERHLRHTAAGLGIDPDTVKVSYGKAAEMQRRGVAHFHAIVRLDGADPARPRIVMPPAGLSAVDLVDAIEHGARTTGFTTDPHPDRPDGWYIGWGEQLDNRVITIGGTGQITDGMVAGYLSKYATKSTEVTGHNSGRLTVDTVDFYADPDGTHTERLVDACWMLGRPADWRGLRRWAHLLGFGGHFLTKSRGYSITFTLLRDQRIAYRRNVTTGPELQAPEEPTTLVVNFLSFVGAGWRNTGDAMLANTSAALAREYNALARAVLAALAN